MRIPTIKKIIAYIGMLCVSGIAQAGILSIDYVADDYFEYTETYTYDTGVFMVSEPEYQKIAPINFNARHEFTFEAPDDFDSGLEGNENISSETIENGIISKISSSTFNQQNFTTNSPFTSILQDSLPELVQESFNSGFRSYFTFTSIVKSDESTKSVIGATPGELYSDSYEQFYLEYSWILHNRDDGNQYYYKFGSWLRMPTIFETIEPNSYTVAELTNFLFNQNVIFTRFNESIAIEDNSDEGTERKIIGYAGYGTYSYQVPEPSSILLLCFALLGFRRFINK